MALRIVHVTPSYWPGRGGAAVYMKELSEGLAARGHRVSVITSVGAGLAARARSQGTPLRAAEVVGGVEVRRFDRGGGLPRAALDGWLRLRGGHRSATLVFGRDGLGMLLQKPSILRAMPLLLRARADVVASSCWQFAPAYHAYLARRLRGFPMVGIPFFHTATEWCRQTVYRRMLGRCDAVVALTDYEAEFIRQRSAAPVVVQGAGIHPDRFEKRDGTEIRRRYSIGSAPVVGFVGRQSADKGARTLLQAMNVVWRWNPDVRLVLAGKTYHPEHRQLNLEIEALPEDQRRRIVRIDDFSESMKASIYDSFDVFAMPSTEESFGISYLEAWMCGKPAIGSRIGSTRCVIDDGVDGLLADPKRPEEVAGLLIGLLADRSRREEMGRRGRAKTLARYTWPRVIDRIEGLYVDLASQARRTDGRGGGGISPTIPVVEGVRRMAMAGLDRT